MKINIMLKSLFIAIGVLPLSLLAADVYWNSAALTGTWDAGANWTGGAVPGATDNVFLTCKDASYAITIKSNATTYAWKTAVGNANGTTMLQIDSPLELFNATTTAYALYFNINKGAKVTVSKTGAMNFVDSQSTWGWGGGGINITGSDLVVDGGVIDQHNGHGIHLSGTAAAPASLVVTNGGCVSWWRSGETYGTFSMTDHTRVHIHDGGFAVNINHYTGYGFPYNLVGGEMLVSGTGVFTNMFTRGTTTAGAFPYTLRGGTVTFTNTAKFVQGISDRSFNVVAKPNAIAEMTFADQSSMGGNNPRTFVVGAGGLGSRSVFRWRSSRNVVPGGVISIIGLGRGQGELEISGGGTVDFEGFGLNVGRSVGGTCSTELTDAHSDFTKTYDPVNYPCSLIGASPSIHSPTGLVSVTKGTLYIHGSWRGSAYGNTRMSGFIIGDGATVTGEVGRLVYGKVTVDGGAITNEAGHFLTGVGKATGILELKSGSVFKGQYLHDQGGVHQPNAVGVGGGDGRWLISGGTATVEGHLFVGGVTTNDLGLFEMNNADNAVKRYRDAKGLVSLSGTGKLQLKDGWNSYSVQGDGTLYPKDDRNEGYPTQGLWLGRDGEGTLELIGSKCSCSIARRLAVTNGWTFSETDRRTDGQGTIRFVFDEEGVGQIKIGTTLILAPNAKLEVDMSAYRGQWKTPVKIIDCVWRVGAFKAENVTLKDCVLVQNAGDPDIYVKSTHRSGFAAVLR